MHRQAISKGRVAYEPNSLAGGCPFQAGARGFVSFPEPVHEDKLRGKPERFAEHYAQARLFYDSQTPWEQAHIVGAFRFELSKLTVPAIRDRMVAGLRNVSDDLASRVADGLGMTLPAPLPLAIERPLPPEVTHSPANMPSVLFDALVLPGGEAAVDTLSKLGHTTEFVVNQFRHNKPILALGASSMLLDGAGISSGRGERLDALGVFVRRDPSDDGTKEFLTALAQHRFPERETDPPRV